MKSYRPPVNSYWSRSVIINKSSFNSSISSDRLLAWESDQKQNLINQLRSYPCRKETISTNFGGLIALLTESSWRAMIEQATVERWAKLILDKAGNSVDNPSQSSTKFSQRANARYGQKTSVSQIQLKNIQATQLQIHLHKIVRNKSHPPSQLFQTSKL